MDAVPSVCRLSASISRGVPRRGRFDAVISLHNGRSFCVVRQGSDLRLRTFYDRLRAIAA